MDVFISDVVMFILSPTYTPRLAAKSDPIIIELFDSRFFISPTNI